MTNKTVCRPLGRLFYWLALALTLMTATLASATGPTMTTISDIVYRANGQPAGGTIVVSWPAFNTADNKPVAAGVLSIAIGTEGTVNFALVPNEGGDPGGTFYKAVYKLNDGTTFTEYWVVPAVSPATIAAIRASVVPRQVGAQFVNRQYVDTAVALTHEQVVHKAGSEAIAGVKSFVASPEVPAPASGVAAVNKDYVTGAISALSDGFVDKSGDVMSGPLTVPNDPAAAGHATNRQYVDLQVADVQSGIAQKLGRVNDTPVNLAAIRFADQFPGANPGAKMDAAAADLAGNRGLVIIPSSTAAGNSLVGIPDNVVVLDLRGDAGPNTEGSENQAFRKDVLLRSRWTTAVNAAQNYQTLHLYAEPFSGGYNTAPSPKTNYNVLNATMASRTKGQHTSVTGQANNYSNGDTQGVNGTAQSWGSRFTSGDEGTVGVRVATQQGYSIMSGSVVSIDSNTLTISSGGTRFLGEDRPLINTTPATIYTAGAISGIAGSPPTVTGVGTNWAAQFGAGAKTNLFFSLDSETNGALKHVVPIVSITNDTTLVLEYLSAGASQAWGGSSSAGSYQIFRGSNVTGMSANVGETSPVSPTVTVADASQFAIGDTIEQPLGYGFRMAGVKIALKRETVSSSNTDTAFEAGLVSGSRPISRVLSFSGEVTGPYIDFSNVGTVYRPTHLIKMAGGNSPSTWIGSLDTVDDSTHTLFSLNKNGATGTWAMNYFKSSNMLVLANQATLSVQATAANTNEFRVTDNSGIAHFQVGSGNTFVNNGANLKGFSDNATTEQWNIAGATGLASFKSVAATSAEGGIDLTSGTGAGLTAALGHSVLWSDSTVNRLQVRDNNGAATSLAKFTDSLSVFAATTSAQLLGVVSDEVGSGSKVAKFDSVSGNSGVAAQSSGTLTSGNCAKFDANGNIVDNGSACGGGGTSFDQFARVYCFVRPSGSPGWTNTCGGFSETGSPSNSPSNTIGTEGFTNMYTTGATINTARGLVQSALFYRINASRENRAQFRYFARKAAGGMAVDLYWFVGLSAGTVAGHTPASAPDIYKGVAYIGFNFCQDAAAGCNTDRTNIQCVMSNVTTQTMVDSGVAPATTMEQKLKVEEDSSNNWAFYIDDVQVCAAMSMTNKPSATNVSPLVAGENMAASDVRMYVGPMDTQKVK